MLNRLAVAIVGIPLMCVCMYFGGVPLTILVAAAVAVGMYEFYKMAGFTSQSPDMYLGILAGLLFVIWPMVEVLAISIIVITAVHVFFQDTERCVQDIGVTILGILYVAVLFSYIIGIREMFGFGWLITLFIMVWVCDSAAYFCGCNFGRKYFNRGLSPLSPKKSIEGALSGIFFTTIIFCIIYCIFLRDAGVSWILVPAFGVIISIVSQIGDLAESMFKRHFGVKDSSHLLGEHGGILDRFDSTLFVMPVAYYILMNIVVWWEVI